MSDSRPTFMADQPQAGPEPDAARIALVALGLGCLCGYMRMYVLGFVGYLSYEVVSSVDAWYALRAVVEIACFALVAAAGWTKRFKLGIRSLLAATVMAIAAAILFAVDPSGTWGPLVAVLGGVGVAVLAYVYTMLLSGYPVRAIVAATLPSYLIAVAIAEGAPLVGPELALVVATISAFIAGAAALRLDPDLATCAPDGPVDSGDLWRIPWLTVAMVVACMFLVTVLFGIAQAMTWLYDWQASNVVVVGASVAAIACTAAMLLRAKSWMHLAWVPMFVLFALAVVFSCLPVRSMIQVAVGCMMAAMFAASSLYWMIIPSLFSTLKIPRAFLAGVLLVLTNVALPSLIGDVLGGLLPRSMQGLGSVSGLMAIVLAVLFAVAFVVNRSRLGTVGVLSAESHAHPSAAQAAGQTPGSEDDQRAEEAANPTDLLKERLQNLGEQFGLTPREFEVALYTVQGFSCAYIADKLVVSNSTVRFHQQNIYKKLEVHSRNELIEFVSSDGASREVEQ